MLNSYYSFPNKRNIFSVATASNGILTFTKGRKGVESSKMRGDSIATCEEIGREMDISVSETRAEP